MTIKRAIISVYNKEGIIPFAQALAERGVELIASGGTAQALTEAGLPVLEVSEYTGQAEILGGWVKTLHPAIHAGILSRRTEADRRELERFGWQEIDLVVVNLHPFERTAAMPGKASEDVIGQIDIGGAELLRSGAKNYAHVTVICYPADYDKVLGELEEDGTISQEARHRLAIKAFNRTSAYDAAIRDYLMKP